MTTTTPSLPARSHPRPPAVLAAALAVLAGIVVALILATGGGSDASPSPRTVREPVTQDPTSADAHERRATALTTTDAGAASVGSADSAERWANG